MAEREVQPAEGRLVRSDPLTPEQRVRNMRAIRRRNTKPELRLRRALWSSGLRGYRCDLGALPGRPDVVFTRQRVAIFVDGTFWHGHPSAFPRPSLTPYWIGKIEGNMRRDRANDRSLIEAGWVVIRLWDSEVWKDLPGCVLRISTAVRARTSWVSPRRGSADA